MTSYPVGENVTYTALAKTDGYVSGDHTYSWSFDDSTTASGASVGKAWSTEGPHLATVIATNTQTGGTASATKSINVSSFAWSQMAGAQPEFFRSPLIGQIDDTRMLVAGGNNSDATRRTKCYIYDGTSFVATGDMITGRSNFNSQMTGFVPLVKLNDGRIMACGNSRATTSTQGFACELYNPSTGVWTATGAMNKDRTYHCRPILMADGKVFVIGGQSYTASGDAVPEIYDPATGVWTNKASAGGSSTDFYSNHPFLLPDGRILVVGHTGGVVKIYNPGTNTWATAADNPFVGGFANGTTAIINNNKLYMFGYNGSNTVKACVYDIAGNSWSEIADTPFGFVHDAAFNVGKYILLVCHTITGSLVGSTLYNTESNTYVIERAFTPQDYSSGNSYDYGFGLYNNKPVIIGDTSTSAPFNIPQVYGAEVG